MIDDLISGIFSIRNDASFTEIALEIFRFQANNNPVYKDFIHSLGRNPGRIKTLQEIPFLPVELYKTHRIIPKGFEPVVVFESSGTTFGAPGRHYIVDTGLYERSLDGAFNMFYGHPSEYCILALLPSYLERKNSSLVYMVDRLIKLSQHPQSGFYLDQLNDLAARLKILDGQQQQVLLIGVSYALMDLAALDIFNLRHAIIMETGGMKGRRKEITREELHTCLQNRFGTPAIHSEYGMAEILSQAYSKENGIFSAPPWMKILIRDIYDPFSYPPAGQTGAINIIDLANIYSCSFLETKDLGQTFPDGSFKVLGRLDNSELRGCNLLVSE